MFPVLSVLLLLSALIPAVAAAQGAREDSIALERAVRLERSDLPFSGSARMLLLRRLRQGDGGGAALLLGFMARYGSADASPWLSPAERLLAETIIADTLLIRNVPRTTSLLANAAQGPRQSPAFDDRLFERLRDLLRENSDAIALRLDEKGPSQAERVFFNLLVNQLATRGYRAQEEINRRVDAFVGSFPASPLAPLAEMYLKKSYGEADFGAAFMAGYSVGVFDGGLRDRFRLYYGPTLSGELYFRRVTLAGMATFGIADAPQGFSAGGHQWKGGSASFIAMALEAGYEFRFGRLAVTPLAGLAGQSVRGDDSAGAGSATLPRTNMRIGYDVGAILGYRIPFDVGPHLDLRVQAGRMATALGDYDPGFSGGLWYLRLGFALVQRPYEGR